MEWVLLGREFAISTTLCLPNDGLDERTFFSIGEAVLVGQDPQEEIRVGYVDLSLPAMNTGCTRPVTMIAIVMPRISSAVAVIAALTRSTGYQVAGAHAINLRIVSMEARVRKTGSHPQYLRVPPALSMAARTRKQQQQSNEKTSHDHSVADRDQ